MLGGQYPQKHNLKEPACLLELTALHVAMNTECHEAAKFLPEHGADIDAVVYAQSRGWSLGVPGWAWLVGMACEHLIGLRRGTLWLCWCQRPSLLSQDIKSGRSPLILAVENNGLNMVQLLLQGGPVPALGLLSPFPHAPTRPCRWH